MAYLAKYKKSDFVHVSWKEYGRTLEKLLKNVESYIKKKKIQIDAVVPILRGGAFPGTFLTFKLNLLAMMPVQYKYFFVGKNIELRRIFSAPKLKFKLQKRPTFLLVENNHCFGITAQTAVNDLKKEFPGCRILYAADHIDYSYQKIKGVDTIFYGKLTNETRALNAEQAKKKGLNNKMFLFPWEQLKEEWTTVQGKQFGYNRIKEIIKGSETKKIIKN